MQRQRGELGNLADLPGPVQAIRKTPPPARHCFTVADQVDQLVGASEADPDLGFMARLMALCSLPRSNPGNRLQYRRVNGPYTLIMTATGKHKLPFGNFPGCCWPGSRPRPCGREGASWFWVVRSRSSCEHSVFTAAAAELKLASATR